MTTPASLPVLAIDPGKDGGAALLAADGVTLLRCWEWRTRARKAGDVVVLTDARHGRDDLTSDLCSLHEVGETIALGTERLLAHLRSDPEPELGVKEQVLLVVEGLFVSPKKRTDPLDVVTLGESAGLVWGPIASMAIGHEPAVRPTWSVWAGTILGVRSNAASERAFQIVLQTFREMPDLGRKEHVRDAVAMARYGWVWRRGSATMRLPFG